MAIENFAIGSYIIPMDATYQNRASTAKPNGMITAYGLVYRLLSAGIPVKWSILPHKPSIDTPDFTASAQDIETMAIISNHGYSGGPFLIDSAHAQSALPVIQAWQANHSVTVHRATAPFQAPIAMTLYRAPRIAVEEKNSQIITGYLNDAGIPDSNGAAWTSSSPGVLDHAEIANYGFFIDPSDPCKKLKYDIFLSPHTSDADWSGNDPTEVAARDALDTFLRVGGMIHATCHSISAIENMVGPFITTSGIPDFPNKGDTGTFTVDKPAFPTAQGVSTPSPQALPGGAEQTWLNSAVTYRPYAGVLAHFTSGGKQYDFMAAGSYKGGTGAGKIVYEGGHEYSRSMSKPYTDPSNTDMLYLRYLLNSVFFSVGKPRIMLTTIPKNIPSGITTTVTFLLANDGGSDAAGLTASITLAPWITYNNGSASIPPSSVIGQTLTWDAAALAGHTGPGTILTFTAQMTPPATGWQNAASYTFVYGDEFDETYALSYCASINVIPGAAPFVIKTPVDQTVNPGSPITWTITGGNNGTLTLENVTVTDTIPAGMSLVSAVPAPSSVVGNVVTWNLPPIPPLTPNGFTITLTVLALSTTTATYTNQVNLTGTDSSPASYSVTATAQVQVVNRPPTVTLMAPNGGEIICGSVTITWTASDPDGDPLTYAVQYSPDGGSTWTTIISGIGTTSYLWITSSLPSGSNYLVKVIASDGELMAEDVSDGPFIIDNTPPQLQLVTPVNGSYLTDTVTISADAVDNVEVTEVVFEYSVDGNNYLLIDTVTDPVGTTYSTVWNTLTVADRHYFLRATAADQCHNLSQVTIQVVFDNTPPTVEIVSPPDGLTVFDLVNLFFSARDNECLTKVDVYIDDHLVFTDLAQGATASDFIYEWNTYAYHEGPHTVKAVATDCAGLTATTQHTYIINNLPDCFTQILVDGCLELPPLKPDAEHIVAFDVSWSVEEISTLNTVFGTKVVVGGFIEIGVSYSASNAEQTEHFASFKKPFAAMILCPNLPLDSCLCPVILLEHEQHHLINPRTIKKSIVLFIGVRPC